MSAAHNSNETAKLGPPGDIEASAAVTKKCNTNERQCAVCEQWLLEQLEAKFQSSQSFETLGFPFSKGLKPGGKRVALAALNALARRDATDRKAQPRRYSSSTAAPSILSMNRQPGRRLHRKIQPNQRESGPFLINSTLEL